MIPGFVLICLLGCLTKRLSVGVCELELFVVLVSSQLSLWPCVFYILEHNVDWMSVSV
jgi:hypothetical protein